MNHRPEALGDALNASIEFPMKTAPAYDCIIYRFEDSRLRYEMHVNPTTGATIFAMDPMEPMQGCPMLEFSFRFPEILIGKSTCDGNGNEIAVHFIENENTLGQGIECCTHTLRNNCFWIKKM